MKYILASTEPTGKRSVYTLKKIGNWFCKMNTSSTFHNIKTTITGKCKFNRCVYLGDFQPSLWIYIASPRRLVQIVFYFCLAYLDISYI